MQRPAREPVLAALPAAVRVDGRVLRAALLSGALVAIEGIDTYGISYVAPLLGAEAHIAPERMGIVFAATVVASLIGAIGLAPLSDRIGRRRLLLTSGLLAALGTLFTPLAGGVASLFALRFLVGLGFGATLPVAVALVVEHAPPARRALLGTLINSSVVVGSILVAAGVAVIVPAWGWRVLMVSAGGLSLLGVALAWWRLPESPALGLQAADPAARRGASNPLLLLQSGYALRTLLLLLQLTLAYLVINFAVYWQPTLILALGHSVRVAGAFGAITQAFAVAAAFLVGSLMDRRGPVRVLLTGYGAGTALFVATQPFATGSLAQLALYLVGLSAISASVSGSLAFTSSLYPATLRATALGWVMGLARLAGGSGGTVVGGYIVAAHWSTGTILLAMGGVMGLATVALYGAVRLREAAGGTELPPSGG